MKKRSLVAALAMLVVSAIVLTSSTYAWFAAANTASVTGISATTANDAGSIYISATGATGTWGTSLEQTSLSAVTGNSFPAALTPVSFDVTAKKWFNANLAQAEGSAISVLNASEATAETLNGKYIKFTVYLYAEVPCTVTVTPTLTSASGYVYGAMLNNGTYTMFGAKDNTYTPIGSAGTAADSAIPANGIIDATEAAASTDGLTLGSAVTVGEAATQTISYTFAEGATGEANKVSFDVFVWAEGQDADCFGLVNTDNITLSLNLAK